LWLVVVWDSLVGIVTDCGMQVRELNPDWGEIIRTWPGCPPTRVSLQVVLRQGCHVEYTPNLAPKLKKNYSYTPTPSQGLNGLF